MLHNMPLVATMPLAVPVRRQRPAGEVLEAYGLIGNEAASLTTWDERPLQTCTHRSSGMRHQVMTQLRLYFDTKGDAT